MSVMAQKFEALEIANQTRQERRTLKTRLRDGTLSAEDVICCPPSWLGSMPVYELLLLLPRLGLTRVNRALRRSEVWPIKPVGALTERQQSRLLVEVESALEPARPAYPSSTESVRQYRSDPEKAERDREVSRRWKREHLGQPGQPRPHSEAA